MDEFLAYIRRRRAKLEQESSDLAVAERIYQESGVEILPGQRALFDPAQPPTQRLTIKKMVLTLLDEMQPRGLTALEILDQIHKRWMPKLERTSLSPQLTRLKNGGYIHSDKGVWKLVENDAPPEGETS